VILVDTSVWIDFFAGRSLPHVAKLERLIQEESEVVLSGIILTEILQGITDDRIYLRVKKSLSSLILLPMEECLFIRAADIYRKLRKKGITIRKTNDCLIAATALEHNCSLLHNDRDFDPIHQHCQLKIVKI